MASRRVRAAASPPLAAHLRRVVEVRVDKGVLSVPRVDTAVDCGTHVNPEHILSQMEGAAVMGLSLAKNGAITFEDGRVEQGNYDDYPVIRMDESSGVTNGYIMPARTPQHEPQPVEPKPP